jgi:hypothetical protein
MSATSSGDGESEVISHAAPTFCIQVPMFDTSAAIDSQKNTRCDSAPQSEARAESCERCGRGPL